MRFKLLAAASAALLAGACTHIDPNSGSPDPQFGEAVKYNALAHTIDPDPVYPDDAAQPGESGAKGAEAVKRYRTDQVNARHRTEAPALNSLSTTQGTGSGPR